ncbi:hypothetical protein V1514DRAFT_323653 [Lipomyces japonicus]|uniref:uncharacterized protein n=1 Tax=Lipomyces japonicus TaxID=56871 RepID=UPI0034CF0277
MSSTQPAAAKQQLKRDEAYPHQAEQILSSIKSLAKGKKPIVSSTHEHHTGTSLFSSVASLRNAKGLSIEHQRSATSQQSSRSSRQSQLTTHSPTTSIDKHANEDSIPKSSRYSSPQSFLYGDQPRLRQSSSPVPVSDEDVARIANLLVHLRDSRAADVTIGKKKVSQARRGEDYIVANNGRDMISLSAISKRRILRTKAWFELHAVYMTQAQRVNNLSSNTSYHRAGVDGVYNPLQVIRDRYVRARLKQHVEILELSTIPPASTVAKQNPANKIIWEVDVNEMFADWGWRERNRQLMIDRNGLPLYGTADVTTSTAEVRHGGEEIKSKINKKHISDHDKEHLSKGLHMPDYYFRKGISRELENHRLRRLQRKNRKKWFGNDADNHSDDMDEIIDDEEKESVYSRKGDNGAKKFQSSTSRLKIKSHRQPDRSPNNSSRSMSSTSLSNSTESFRSYSGLGSEFSSDSGALSDLESDEESDSSEPNETASASSSRLLSLHKRTSRSQTRSSSPSRASSPSKSRNSSPTRFFKGLSNTTPLLSPVSATGLLSVPIIGATGSKHAPSHRSKKHRQEKDNISEYSYGFSDVQLSQVTFKPLKDQSASESGLPSTTSSLKNEINRLTDFAELVRELRYLEAQFFEHGLRSSILHYKYDEALKTIGGKERDEQNSDDRRTIKAVCKSLVLATQNFQNNTLVNSRQLLLSLSTRTDELTSTLSTNFRARFDFAISATDQLNAEVSTTLNIQARKLGESLEILERQCAFFGRREQMKGKLEKFGYAVLEKFVLLFLWGVWGVVSVIRLGRWTFSCIFHVLRWLIWC